MIENTWKALGSENAVIWLQFTIFKETDAYDNFFDFLKYTILVRLMSF